MATQTTGGGSTTSFTTTPQAQDDTWTYSETNLAAQSFLLIDVMSNDLGGKAKVLWSIDDGDNDAQSALLPEYSESDLFNQDPLTAFKSAWELTEQGNWIRINCGKVEYRLNDGTSNPPPENPAGSPSFNTLSAGLFTDTFIYAIRLANGTLSTAKVTINITGDNDGPTVSASTASAFTEAADASAQDLSQSGTVSFDDVDSNDVIDISSAYNGDASWTGGDLPAGLAAALAAGFSASTTDAAAPGSIAWTYLVDDLDLDFLAEGESITLSFTVTATDNHGSGDTDTVTITINGTNDDPIITTNGGGSSASISVSENSSFVTTVGASDSDTTNTITYSIVGGADAALFTIDPYTGVLSFVAQPDAENPGDQGGNNIYNVIVRASDNDNGYDDQSFVIAINDVDEFDVSPVVDNNAAANQVDENAATGTVVGVTAFASDADATTNTVSYSLTDSAGGLFAIDSVTGIVTVAGAIDRELVGASLTIEVTATSADGSTSSQSFVIAINDVDEGELNDFDEVANQPSAVIMTSGVNGNQSPLAGSQFNDTLMGGQAGDTIYGGAGDDTIYGFDPTTSNSQADGDTIYGGSGNDTIFGNQDGDIIYGGSGNDIIRGNGGNDTLYGGQGTDQFIYDRTSDPVDLIMDFEHGVDKIIFDNSAYTALADGPLSASAFATGTATTAAHRIVYNNLTGELFYDADGSGAGTQVLIADFNDLPVLTASDFLVI